MMSNMNNKALRQRTIQRYLDAETSIEEEKALFEFYSHTKETLSAEEEQVRQLVLSTAHLTDDFTLSDEKVKEFDHIMAEKERSSSHMTIWPWLAAACIAAFMVVLLAPPKHGGSGNYEGGRELSMEVKSIKEDVHHPSIPQDCATRTTSSVNLQTPSIKHQTSNIKIPPTLEEEDQSDLVSVENVFGIESRPDPLKEYTALEEKLQKECDEVFSTMKIDN